MIYAPFEVYDYQMKWVSSPVYSNRFAMTPQAIQAREYGCPGAANGNPQWPPNLASGLESRYVWAFKFLTVRSLSVRRKRSELDLSLWIRSSCQAGSEKALKSF